MNARHGALVGVASSVCTLLVVFALLAASGAAFAGKGAPPDPLAADENSRAAAPDPQSPDENAGAQVFDFVPEEIGADAVTEYIHFPGSAFVPMYSNTGFTYSPWGCMYMTGPQHSSNYALILPPGSTVTYLRLYYYDTNAGGNGIMRFAEYDDGAGGSYLAELSTAGSGGTGTTTLSNLNIPLDYVNYSYVFYWDPGTTDSTMRLCGMRVGFVAPIGRSSLIPSQLYNRQQP